MSLDDDYRACAMRVRAGDRDHYLSALFAPAEKRRHLLALAAFNSEVGRIRDVVSEPMLGEVRLQWWRDAVDGTAAGDASMSPIARALADTVRRFNLPRAGFHVLFDARAFDFYGEPMPTLEQLESYLDATAGSLIRLAAHILHGGETPEVAAAAAQAGRAHAITGLLRSFAPNAACGRIFVPPLDVIARHGSSAEEATSGVATPHLRAALREMRDLARYHLAEARAAMAALPETMLPAFLPLELVPVYLQRMERPDYDPFHSVIEMPPWRKPWLLWRAARRPRR